MVVLVAAVGATGCAAKPAVYQIPDDICAPVDLAPFEAVFGEVLPIPPEETRQTAPPSAKCFTMMAGVVDATGRHLPGGSVQFMVVIKESPEEARQTVARMTPASATTPFPTPPSVPADVIWNDYRGDRAEIQLAKGNIYLMVLADSLSPEPVQLPVLPGLVDDLAAQILALLEA